MPNNCLSVLYKRIIQVEKKNVGLKVGGGGTNIPLPPQSKTRGKTRCRHMGYSFQLTARVLLYAPSHRQDSTYHGLCGALAGTRNSSMGPPHQGSIRRPIAP